jgi:hypothetical protein
LGTAATEINRIDQILRTERDLKSLPRPRCRRR